MSRIRPGIHGDRVAVSVLPFADWVDTVQDWIPRDSDEFQNSGGFLEVRSGNGAFHRAVSGRVVKVVREGHREFVCSVSFTHNNLHNNASTSTTTTNSGGLNHTNNNHTNNNDDATSLNMSVTIEYGLKSIVMNRKNETSSLIMAPLNKRIPLCVVPTSNVPFFFINSRNRGEC